MTRRLYGGSEDDWVANPAGAPVSNVRVRFYVDAGMVTEITDVTSDLAGTVPTTVVTGPSNGQPAGFYGPFYLPGSYSAVYAGASVGGAAPTEVVALYPHDTDAAGAAAAAQAAAQSYADTHKLDKAQNLADVASTVAARSALGLGNVDNTSDVNKPVSTAQQTALNLKADLVAGVLPTAQLPVIPRNKLPNISGSYWQTVANQAAMLALATPDADTLLVVFRADTPGYIWYLNPGLSPATLSNWQSAQEDAAGAAAAVQANLTSEAATARAAESANATAIANEATTARAAEASKADAAATTAALALKAPLASPALTGNPTAPTQTQHDNSTRLATTAYADTAVSNLVGAAPALLDTLAKIDTQLASDESAASVLTSTVAGKLTAASNLGDVADPGSSRANLHIAALATSKCVATTNQALTGLPVIDGYQTANNDLVLLVGQTTASQNGQWQLPASGSGAWARPTDFPSGAVTLGRSSKVVAGTVYAATDWVLMATSTITVDASAQTWKQVGSGAYLSLAPQAVTKTRAAVIAHRAGGAYWDNFQEGPHPEETLLGIEAAVAAGQTAISLHVQMLSDGTLVLMHDQTVARTTSGAGNVADYTGLSWRSLSVIYTQQGFNLPNLPAQSPPLFEDVLRRFGGKVHLEIEAISWNSEATGQAIVNMVTAYGLQSTVLIASFSTGQLTAAIAAGIATQYGPPNYPATGSDAATILSKNAWPTGAAKVVGINYRPALTSGTGGATTNGSPTVTITGGPTLSSAYVGAAVSGTGIPYGATVLSVESSTSFTLSANATATNTGLTIAFTATQAMMTPYIQSLVAAGLTVSAYIVNRRYDKAWLTAAGVTYFVSDDPVYLAASSRLTAATSGDPAAKGVWPHGILLSDYAFNRGRGTITAGTGGTVKGIAMDDIAYSGSTLSYTGTIYVLWGDLCPPANLNAYTISTDIFWATVPSGDMTRHADVLFCCPDDRQVAGVSSGAGVPDGYTVIFRANGQLGLFKTNRAAQTSVQIGSTQSTGLTVTAGMTTTLRIQVTSTQVILTVVQGGTTYGPYTFTDSTYRGGYAHAGKTQGSGTSAFIPVFTNRAVA